jgi:hypothetical protein
MYELVIGSAIVGSNLGNDAYFGNSNLNSKACKTVGMAGDARLADAVTVHQLPLQSNDCDVIE